MTSASAGVPRRRRRPLPDRRRRLRETLDRAVVEPAPRRVRRADAQNAGHRHRRPATPPRPPLPNRRRLDPPHPSPRRERSPTPALNPRWPAPPAGGQINWPSPGTSPGHRRADFLTASGQKLLALDSLLPEWLPARADLRLAKVPTAC